MFRLRAGDCVSLLRYFLAAIVPAPPATDETHPFADLSPERYSEFQSQQDSFRRSLRSASLQERTRIRSARYGQTTFLTETRRLDESLSERSAARPPEKSPVRMPPASPWDRPSGLAQRYVRAVSACSHYRRSAGCERAPRSSGGRTAPPEVVPVSPLVEEVQRSRWFDGQAFARAEKTKVLALTLVRMTQLNIEARERE